MARQSNEAADRHRGAEVREPAPPGRGVTTMGRAFRVLLGIVAGLAGALCVVAIVMCLVVIRGQEAQEVQSAKRVVAIDAAQANSAQQACISRTTAAWELAIT